MLKFKLDAIEGLEPTVSSLYIQNEEDKKYYLNVEGVVAKEKLEEFRDKNVEILKENDNLKVTFKDIDPKKYRDLLKMEADGKFSGKTNEEIDRIIGERVGSMRTELEGKIGELEKVKEVQASQLNVMLVDNVVRDAANKGGVTGAAVDDILLRAKTIFRLVDGKPVPHDDRGNVLYGNDGTTPLSVVGWVGSLKKTAPHLFPSSQGSGAPGGRPGTGVPDNMTSLQKISAGLAEKA